MHLLSQKLWAGAQHSVSEQALQPVLLTQGWKPLDYAKPKNHVLESVRFLLIVKFYLVPEREEFKVLFRKPGCLSMLFNQ